MGRASVWLVLFLLLTACQSTTPLITTNSKSEAQALAQRLAAIHYDYHVQLTDDNGFEVKATLDFTLDNTLQDLPLNLQQAQISRVMINGQLLYPDYNGDIIRLPARLLHQGNNQVQLSYRGQYRQQGQGLIRIVDPKDQQTYIYSRFEPHGASHAFALFDQPDLRAEMSLIVTAPVNWQVISSTMATKDNQASPTWQFTKTPPLSPHQLALFAGPFRHWQHQQQGVNFRLFALDSTREDLGYERWLQQTANNLHFISQRLNARYPFSKFDQILLPGLNVPTMSQAAAVSVTDSLPLDADAISQHMQNSQLLAKQWFGSLISLPWWDDVNLHAGLGLYLANTTAIDAGIEPAALRQYQFLKQKQPAYQYQLQHQARNSHNVATSEFHTQQALAAKAAVTLKQIETILGENRFRQILQDFIQRYSWQSAGHKQWIAQLKSAAVADFWTEHEQRPLNRLRVDWQCQQAVLKQLTLHQQHPQKQSLNLALFYQDRHGIHLDKSITATIDKQVSVIKAAKFSVCPDFVYPNYQDTAYSQVALDPKSLHAAIRHLSQIASPLMQMMLLEDIWQASLRDELRIEDYLGMIMLNLPEISAPAVQRLAQQQLAQLHQLLRLMPPSQASQRLYNALEEFSVQLVYQQGYDSIWLDSYLAFAQSPQAMDHLHYLLQGFGWPLTQAQRWQAIIRLNQFDANHHQAWLNSETRNDPSLVGQQQALIARLANPNAAHKRRFLSELNHAPANANTALISQYLYPGQQPLAQAVSFEQIWQLLPQLVAQDPQRADMLVNGLIVLPCTQQNIEMVAQASAGLSPSVLQDTMANHVLFMQQCHRMERQLNQ
ncbi:M1 family aminopeptidase [Shewanella sp. NIFS-20-20]|uniref:M1 family aminopeptidase n=1 Tax=Shewanella sp. NIFS-20-20 TaxID=2853806 RepID=UPI001C47672F|nr:M1 family aminopeptidase [Shewanella sp. NIFS-20-20]MBV7315835.1 ERAP1-like C-terminal domain-containing protein [Shewanella sp. NIFS-20-20]